MKATDKNTQGSKPQWEKPALVRLGTIRDIAGPSGVGFQAGPNSRS